MPDRPYPRRCSKCQASTIMPATIPTHRMVVRFDGDLHELDLVDMPVNKCSKCGEVWFTNNTDDHVDAAIAAWRKEHGPNGLSAADTRRDRG